MQVRREPSRYTLDRATPEAAASYNVKYQRFFHKRISNRTERALLERLLARVIPVDSILDVPSGAGRVAGHFYRAARQVIEADYSLEMLKLLRANLAHETLRLAAASVFHLPFRDRSFDLVISIRLSHHIPDEGGRHLHLQELMRVSRRFVLVSFFDSGSLKNRLREQWRRFGMKKRGKYTLSRTAVSALGRRQGFLPIGYWSLSWLFSGHTFALLERAGVS